MEHALLVAFLERRATPKDFGREIKDEVDACERGIRSPANVGYIIITDGPQTTVTRKHGMRLLECLLDGSLPFKSANYTADCLLMSDDFHFQDEAVEEAIEFVADDADDADDSGPPTTDQIRSALLELG